MVGTGVLRALLSSLTKPRTYVRNNHCPSWSVPDSCSRLIVCRFLHRPCSLRSESRPYRTELTFCKSKQLTILPYPLLKPATTYRYTIDAFGCSLRSQQATCGETPHTPLRTRFSMETHTTRLLRRSYPPQLLSPAGQLKKYKFYGKDKFYTKPIKQDTQTQKI